MSTVEHIDLAVAADVLGCEIDAELSFTALGGTSLRAIELAARVERRYGRTVSVAALLGPEPLGGVLAAARSLPPTVAAVAGVDGTALAAPVQEAMLVGEQLHGGAPFHLLFSLDLRGSVDPERLRKVLAGLTRRHAGLRTMFVRGETGLRRRVLAHWEPTVRELLLPAGTDPVPAVQELLGAAAGGLLDPFRRPPVVFVVSPVGPSRTVLSLLVHHVLVDGWSVGLLLRELVAGLGGAEVTEAAPSMESVVAAARGPEIAARARRRAEELAGVPTTLELPSDVVRPARATRTGARLRFALSDAARDACAALARDAGVTRNAMLLAAWSLVIGRRTGLPEFPVGVVSAGRTAATWDVVGPCLTVVPVRCGVDDTGTAGAHVRRVAAGLREALASADVPFEELVAALELGGDDSRHPLVQVAFAAHDELVPDVVHAPGLTATVHEGHCGGTIYDAVLYVQQWASRPMLALEYATDVLAPDEATELATALDQALVDLSAADGLLANCRTTTPAQRDRLAGLGAGSVVPTDGGLWDSFAAVAAAGPDRIAVRDGETGRPLSYAELCAAAVAQSAELAAAGVRARDRVALAVGRSAQELVAILGVLRLGAAYTAIEADVPAPAVTAMLDAAGVQVVLGEDSRLAALGSFARPDTAAHR
ncbi:condensation domain-containing protein [Actinoplanes sp. NPDC051859]|uniref:condensation domain-containing protein n=1 Tax=Actinoplanes sp. NPDC051859 TaxID=3363909 RepID=UPI0037A4C937